MKKVELNESNEKNATHSRGIVVVNISRSEPQTVVHTGSEKWAPFEISRFSKQLMPERANCSLSSRNNNEMRTVCKKYIMNSTDHYDRQLSFSTSTLSEAPAY